MHLNYSTEFHALRWTTGHSRLKKHFTVSKFRATNILFSSFDLFSAKAAGSAIRISCILPRRPSGLRLVLNHISRADTLRHYASKNKNKNKMPPKKAVKEEKILLGRPGNNLKSGIVRAANMCVLRASIQTCADESSRSVLQTWGSLHSSRPLRNAR